jgi:hypothetical protein
LTPVKSHGTVKETRKGRHLMSYRRNYRQAAGSAGTAPVTPRQAAALDKMAAANGFVNGSALLADVASSTVAELGRQPRTVIQMFVSQAFERYGRASRPAARGRCEDAPCCGCCD